MNHSILGQQWVNTGWRNYSTCVVCNIKWIHSIVHDLVQYGLTVRGKQWLPVNK